MRRSPWLAIFLYTVLAAGLAILLQAYPSDSFPLTSDKEIEVDAWGFAQKGAPYWQERATGGWLPHMRFSRVLSLVYWISGRHPLLLRFLSALIGAGLLYFTWRLGLTLFGGACAKGALWILALWPSLLYRGATISRDLWIALWMVISLWRIFEAAREATWKNALLALVSSWIVGYYRPQTWALLWVSVMLWLGLWFVVKGFKAFPRRRPIFILLISFLLLPLLMPVPGLPTIPIPSPQNLSQWHNRYTEGARGRIVLFPHADWKSWGDVFLHSPKAIFYSLFMPFPGLFPTEKLSQTLAAFENLIFLFIFLLALRGLWCLPRTWSHGFLVFFSFSFIGFSALLEPDLGSAMRHKLHYLPIIVLWASHAVFSLRVP